MHPRTPEGQIDALNAAGCEKIFADTTSGKLTERPELTLCLGHLAGRGRAGGVAAGPAGPVASCQSLTGSGHGREH